MERAITQIEKSRDEIRDLRSDMRVLEKEIQVRSMETVVNAHAQLIERLVRVENGLGSSGGFVMELQKKSNLGDGSQAIGRTE